MAPVSLVTTRQQPGTAKGAVFVTLEDEAGTVNVIVWKSLRDLTALLGDLMTGSRDFR